jgi:predicted alpha/beta hydrolase family esterase
MLVRRLAKPWIEKKLDFSRIKKMILPGKSIYLISDDDYYVDMKNSFVFQKLLGVKIIVEHHKGHYAESDGIRKMPIVVKELLRISH